MAINNPIATYNYVSFETGGVPTNIPNRQIQFFRENMHYRATVYRLNEDIVGDQIRSFSENEINVRLENRNDGYQQTFFSERTFSQLNPTDQEKILNMLQRIGPHQAWISANTLNFQILLSHWRD